MTMSNKWQGTAVPNSGYADKVYFNTNLSVDEVVALVNTLEFTNTFAGPIYIVASLYENENNSQIGIQIVNGVIAIVAAGGPVFISEDAFGMGFTGWKPDFVGEIAFSNDASDKYNIGSDGDVTVGAENDKLSSLFSTTPFVKEEDKPKYDWLRELFINEAKPALERHSGSKAPSYEETENEAGGITVTIGSKGE